MKLFGTAGGGVRTHRQYKLLRHEDYTTGETTGGLSVLFTILCIVDLFGVFPVVALPKSVIACGAYAVPLVVLVIGLQLYTAMLLGRSWLLAQDICPKIRDKLRFPYAAVAELAFGNGARRLVTFLIDATVFGAGIPNFIFASQSMQLFWWKISDGEVGISYCVWMLIIGLLLCPVMWLGSPKDMKTLAVTSVCIVTTVAVLVWSCILTDTESPPSLGFQGYSPGAQDFLVAYGIMAFQFDIHPMLLTIQVDMKDSRRIKSAVIGGFGFTVGLFTITTALAAYRYGTAVDYNILQGIPPSLPLYTVALLVTVQLCLSSAVGNSALFQHIEDLLGIPREFCFRRCILRSGIVTFAVFLGETVPRFDLVMGLVGSTLTGPLMFIFPPLIFLKLCHMKAKQNTAQKQNGALSQNGGHQNGINQNGVDLSKYPLVFHNALEIKYQTFSNSAYGYVRFNDFFEHHVQCYEIVLAIIVMVMGIGATLVAAVSSWSDTINYATFTPPCLLNATAAARNLFLNP